jgi:hypothetical protein
VSEVIFTMVTDTDALRAVAEGPRGLLAGLGPGKVYVDMSTVSPAASRDLAARVRERGARMLDCPIRTLCLQSYALEHRPAHRRVAGDRFPILHVRTGQVPQQGQRPLQVAGRGGDGESMAAGIYGLA